MVKDLRERRKPPVQARSRETVAIILEATGKIVAERGIKALSMREVGRVAGVSSGTLYQYFKSSNALLASWEEAMFQRSAADFTAAFTQMMAEPDPPRWEVAIYRMVRVGLDPRPDASTVRRACHKLPTLGAIPGRPNMSGALRTAPVACVYGWV